VALVLLGLHLNACSTWDPVAVSPRQFVEEEQPAAIRITRADGNRLVVRYPLIENDSIHSVQACQALLTPREPGGCAGWLPLADVSALEVERVNVLRTLALILVVPLALVALTPFEPPWRF